MDKMCDKKYNVLDSTLHEITAESIRISTEEKKKYKENFNKVLDRIVSQMKMDEVFKCLYKHNWYAGSSYENLKISSPNEFDINLIFEWPGNACQVVSDKSQPGYVKLKINMDDPSLKKILTDFPNVKKKLNKWIDKNDFFIRDIFKRWMQGMICKALDNISVEGTEIKQSTSGPAITLNISKKLENIAYSVDLVPAFVFTEKDWPAPPVRSIPSGVICKEWSVVPKEPMSEKEAVYWKTSFFKQEKELMNNRRAMKHVIKLTKLLRDCENWSGLYSYAIKTVFLWECVSTNTEYWQIGLGNIFMLMLNKLSNYLSEGNIPYFWDQNLNLIEKMKPQTQEIMRNRINVITKEINSNLNNNPTIIKKYFGYKTEKTVKRNSPDVSNALLLEDTLIDTSLPSESTSDPSICPTYFTPANIWMKNTTLMDTSVECIDIKTAAHSRQIETSNNPLKCGINPKEENLKMNRNGLEYNHKDDEDFTTINDSMSTDQILLLILEEQRVIKQYLQSVSKNFNEICNETRVLREEIADLRKQLQAKEMTSTAMKTSPPIENTFDFKTLNNLISSNDPTCSNAVSNLHQPSFSINTTASRENMNKSGEVSHFPHVFSDNDMKPCQSNYQDLIKM